jgi:hypothetical protein
MLHILSIQLNSKQKLIYFSLKLKKNSTLSSQKIHKGLVHKPLRGLIGGLQNVLLSC